MRKNKFYKKAFSLLAATTITLFSGCTGASNNENRNDDNQKCEHLTVYFEDEAVTFKECEGYDIYVANHSGMLNYSVSLDGKKIIEDGWTNQFNYYEINHKCDEVIETSSVQKVK